MEEHQVMGGFGSAVAEALAEAGIIKPLRLLGIPDQFVEHATQKAQLSWFGLNGEPFPSNILPCRRRAAAPLSPVIHHNESMNASLFARKLLLWLPPIIVAALIYLLSTDIGSSSTTRTHVFRVLSLFWPSVNHLSSASQDLIETAVRKAAHVTIYTLFSTTLFGSFYSSGFKFRTSLAGTLAIVFLFALGDEYHQGFVKSRTSSLRDVGFDLAGGLLGAIAVSYGALLERLRQGTLNISRMR